MTVVRDKANKQSQLIEDDFAATFELIAAVFSSPDQRFKDDIDSGRLQKIVSFLADGLGLEPVQYKIPDWYDLQSNYVRLFLTNPSGLPAPPYLAYAIDGLLLGPSFKELKSFYRHNGLVINDSYHDLPDHISVVAEAAVLLLDDGKLQEVKELIIRFFLPWFEKYITRITAIDSEFYGPICQFCKDITGRLVDEAKA